MGETTGSIATDSVVPVPGHGIAGGDLPTRMLVLGLARHDGSILAADAFPVADACGRSPEQIRSFEAAQNVDRVLATVLFADIVDSTGRAARMGDRAWRSLLDRYVEIVRAEVGRWMGGHLELTGDGVMATFETPTRALRCAFSLREAVAGLGIQVRAGLHTGEIERREGGIGGIAVHIAARVMSAAEPGQVVATRTVRDLATGTDLAFAPRGVESLRGVPGTWELFAVSLR